MPRPSLHHLPVLLFIRTHVLKLALGTVAWASLIFLSWSGIKVCSHSRDLIRLRYQKACYSAVPIWPHFPPPWLLSNNLTLHESGAPRKVHSRSTKTHASHLHWFIWWQRHAGGQDIFPSLASHPGLWFMTCLCFCRGNPDQCDRGSRWL